MFSSPQIRKSVLRCARICHLLTDSTVLVVGTAALHLQKVDLAGTHELHDVDVVLTPCEDRTTLAVLDALGEMSAFAAINDIYVDVLRPSICAFYPEGWVERTVRINNTVRAVHVSDVLACKLAVRRDNDLEFLKNHAPHLLRD